MPGQRSSYTTLILAPTQGRHFASVQLAAKHFSTFQALSLIQDFKPAAHLDSHLPL